MTADSTQPHDTESPTADAPSQLQDAIRARARYTLARDQAARKRSPRQRFIAAVLMVVAVGLFLFVIDLGVRTMHRVLELWFPAHTQAPPDVTKPYLITVDPTAAANPSADPPAVSQTSSSTPRTAK